MNFVKSRRTNHQWVESENKWLSELRGLSERLSFTLLWELVLVSTVELDSQHHLHVVFSQAPSALSERRWKVRRKVSTCTDVVGRQRYMLLSRQEWASCPPWRSDTKQDRPPQCHSCQCECSGTIPQLTPRQRQSWSGHNHQCSF